MEAAVADMASVNVELVSVELSVGNVTSGSRRLRDTEERRLQDGEVVICDANISVADEAAGDALAIGLQGLTPEEITTTAQAALTAAGMTVVVNVTGGFESVGVTVPPSPPPTPSGQASAASLRWKAFSLAPFFAVSAWLFSNV